MQSVMSIIEVIVTPIIAMMVSISTIENYLKQSRQKLESAWISLKPGGK
jgi:hypothetical protein